MADILNSARKVASILANHSFEVLFTGRGVLDSLLGHSPKSVELVTSASPMDLLQIFDKCGPVASYPNRLIVSVDNDHFEVVALGGGYAGTYSGKDFTINSILLDPFSGEVLDIVGGKQDLQNKIVRTVEPPATLFQKDPLAIIRAAYLIASLNFDPVGDLVDGVQHNRDALSRAPMRDMKGALERVFFAHYAPKGIRFLVESGVFLSLFGLAGRCKSLPSHIASFHRAQNYMPTLYWAALFQEFPISQVSTYLFQLQMSSQDTETIKHIIADQSKMSKAKRMSQAEIKRFVRRPHFSLSILLQEALFGARNTPFLKSQIKEYTEVPPEDSLFPPKLLDTKDLMQLGLEPGPVFNDIFAALEEEQLSGKVRTKEEAEKFVHTYLGD